MDWTTHATLPSGEEVLIRPLKSEDARELGEYLRGLSAESKGRFGPHPFDQTTIDQICAGLDTNATIRLVAYAKTGNAPVIAYFILQLWVQIYEKERYAASGIPLNDREDCVLAPSVADDYQDKKLGSAMLEHLLKIAREIGRKRIVLMGGTQATNARAIRFYQKFGFRTVGEYMTEINNYDMILEL
jgi:diamine N-acetyltransferase